MKQKLIDLFELAKNTNAQYVGVKIKSPNLDKAEIILSPQCDLDAKLEYYKNAYDDNLSLKTNSDVQIIDCFMLDNFIL